MKAIKYTLYAIAGLLVLLVLGGAIFAMTFDPNKYKGQIETLVKERTGRTLKLHGNLEVAFWPALGARVNGVSLSERAGDSQFLSLDSAHASVAVVPLLHGEAVVDGIRISGLKAHIVREKDGSFNFSDLLEPQGASTPEGRREGQREAKKKAEERKQAGGQAVAFDIASIRVERSSVSYADKASGQEIALADLDLSTGRIAEKADGKLSLKVTAKGKNPDVDAKLDASGNYRFDLAAKSFELSKLDARLNGSAAGITKLDLSAKGDVAANPEKNEYRVKGFALDVKGVKDKQDLEAHVAAPELVIAADRARGGAVSADLTLKEAARVVQAKIKLSGVEGSAKALAIPQLAVDLTVTDPSLPQKSFRIPVSGSLKADLDKQTANADLHAKFDESDIQAKLALAKFSPPAYRFDVDIDRLNVDRYTGAEAKKPAPQTPGGPSEKPAPGAKKPAEDTPVDLSFLKGLDAQGRVNAGALQVNGLKLSNLRAEVRASDGQLDLPHTAQLYEGSITGALNARADGRVAVKDSLTGVQIGPLLRDFAQKDALEGKGNLSLDVNTAGKSVNAMKKALAGNARMQLKDGAIKGINLAEVFRKAKSALGSQSAREEASKSQKTDFSELNATFTIKNGVAHNEDLDMKAPLFRVTGKGDIDIGNSSLDYVTKAAVVASTKGQGGADLAQLSGLTVPVRLHGPFDAMAYDVDYGAAAAGLARSKAGDAIKERLGLGKPEAKGQPAQGSTTDKSNLDKLKGLLGR